MFRKLISNLPFNPSLIGQVSFYAARVKQEEGLRRLGFAFMALALFVQMFAVIAPPEKSLAYSSDYIINGLQTRDDILRAWDGQTADRNVAEIYGRFGLTRNDIASLTLRPNVTVNSCHTDYWTIGRTSLSAVSKAGQIKQQYKNNEVPVNYGGGSVYLRQLKAWDIINNCNTYRAFEGWKNGKQFWILVNCGNFTQVGLPPTLKNPGLDLHKTIEGGPRTLKPGDSFTFNFSYRNPVAESVPAEDVMLEDDLDLKNFDITGFEYPLNPGASISRFLHPGGHGNSYLSLPLGRVEYSSGYRLAARITVRLKANLPNGTKACNAAKLRSLRNNVPEAWSGGNTLCITINKPEPLSVCDTVTGQIITIEQDQFVNGRHAPANDPRCKCPQDSSLEKNDSRCSPPVVVCTITNTAVNRTTKEYTLTTVANSSNEYMTTILRYDYDFGDDSPVFQKTSSAYTDQVKHTYADGTYNGSVTVHYRVGRGGAEKDASTDCSLAVESEPDQPLTQEKGVRNITQDLDEAKTLSAKAKAGDVLEYSLITNNPYDYDRANINVSDVIGDVLEYANLDQTFLKSQGGTYDRETKTISWDAQTAKANGQLINKFRVTLKNPLPSTNQPSAMTTSFDCHISNRLGSSQIDIEVDCPLPKKAEYLTTSLPRTGPGTGLAIGVVSVTIIAYFFARSHLLREELELIRTDFAQTGGV